MTVGCQDIYNHVAFVHFIYSAYFAAVVAGTSRFCVLLKPGHCLKSCSPKQFFVLHIPLKISRQELIGYYSGQECGWLIL